MTTLIPDNQREPEALDMDGGGSTRRLRLREFQSQLVERMQAAGSATQPQANRLGIIIGSTRWLLDLRDAGEIVSVGQITRVPLTRDWFLGLANIRGNLTSVVDLARFCGAAPTPVEKDSRIIAFAPGLSFNGGLLVSRVVGLRSLADMELQTSGDRTTGSPWAARHYVDRDAQTWTELHLPLIVQDPRFLHVGL